MDGRNDAQVGDSRTADRPASDLGGADRADTRADVVSGLRVDAAVDRREVGADARDAAAPRDITGGDGSVSDARDTAGPGTDGRDGAVSGDTSKLDVPFDLVKDANKDTTPDIRKLDAPVEAPPRNSCVNPIEIPMDNPHVDLTLSTAGEDHKFDLPCGQGGGPDLVLKFSLLQWEMVYADTFGANWNTVLHISKTCPPGQDLGNPDGGLPACNDDGCGTGQSQVAELLPNNRYYLYVSGANGESGPVTLHFQHALAGSGPASPLPAGTGSVSGTTGEGLPPSGDCQMPGPADTYWWTTCPDYAGGAFSASTCTGTSFDTVLSLQVPRTDSLSCVNDTDACGRQSSLKTTVPPGAGLNVLSLGGGGSVSAGPYVLTYTRP